MNKILGQNQLVDKEDLLRVKNLIERNIVEEERGMVFEIGFGLCNLTRILSEIFKKVEACEVDPMIWNRAKNKNEIKNANFNLMDASECEIPYEIVVGNLPFSVFKKILMNLIKQNMVKKAFISMQHEAAEKIVEKIKGKFSWILRYFFDPIESIIISNKSFRPVPKVKTRFIFLKRMIEFDESKFTKIMRLTKILGNCKNKKIKNSTQDKEILDMLKDRIENVEDLRAIQIPIEVIREVRV